MKFETMGFCARHLEGFLRRKFKTSATFIQLMSTLMFQFVFLPSNNEIGDRFEHSPNNINEIFPASVVTQASCISNLLSSRLVNSTISLNLHGLIRQGKGQTFLIKWL